MASAWQRWQCFQAEQEAQNPSRTESAAPNCKQLATTTIPFPETRMILAASAHLPVAPLKSIDALHEVRAATEHWAHTFNAGDPSAIAALYEDDAVLWGTVAPSLLQHRQAIHAYFARACVPGALPRVQIEQQHVRVVGGAGELALNAGSYLFHVIEQGRERPLPARFSMVWRKTVAGWRLIDHHSSARPAG